MIHGGDLLGYKLKYDKEPIDFSANVSPFGLPLGIKNAITNNLDNLKNYPDPLSRDLREAISFYDDVLAENIICGNGASDLIFRLVYSEMPKNALLIAPTFYEYENALKSVDCNISYYYAKKENNFEIKEDFFSHITKNLDMIFICQPNNPTGVALPKNFMLDVLNICEENDILLVVDECFMDFVIDFDEYSIKNMKSKNLFILKAFTKMFALAGVRVGYAFCYDDDIIKKMYDNFQPWSVSYIAEIAGIQATKEISYVEDVRKSVLTENLYLKNALKNLDVYFVDGLANFIFFYTSVGNFKQLLEEKGFLIRDCSNYVGLGEGYFRIAVKTNLENSMLLDAISQILNDNIV